MKNVMHFRIILFLMLAFVSLSVSAREKDLRMGVYIYDYIFRRIAEGHGEDFKSYVEKHFQILQKHHVNTLHLTVRNADGKDFREIWLPLMKKYGIKAYLQLDFAYFLGESPAWNEKEEDRKAKLAVKFIREFQNEPMIIAFSIREEVPQNQVNAMARFYAKLQSEVPGFKIVTIHNNLGAAKDHPVPDPSVMGTDRYSFWWEFSGDGYLATPTSALNWLRTDADRYYQEAAKRGADYLWVVTADAYANARNLEGWKKFGIKKPKLAAKIDLFSKEQRFGWNTSTLDGETMLWHWKYYCPPVNCTRAMIWTGILEGARGVLFWSYTPVDKAREGKTVEQILWEQMAKRKGKPNKFVYYSWTNMAGRPGQPNQPLEEFAATAEELQPYSKLICMMNKLPDSPVKTSAYKKIYNRAFSITGYKGRVVVLHNANIGSWGGNSKAFFSDKDNIRIDNNGVLLGYTPFKAKADVEFSVNASEKVFDFASGKELELTDGKGKTKIIPGGGTFLFIGTKQEFDRLKKAAAVK